jgi:SAM-dependent methyltransferase
VSFPNGDKPESDNMQFDQFADRYEQVLDSTVAVSGEDAAYFAAYKALYLRRVLFPLLSGKAMDFGCGVGLLSRFLKTYFPAVQLDGFDVSQDSIGKIDDDLKSQGHFTSRTADLAHDYGLIVGANVMHHIAPREREAVIQDLAGRLAPRGILAIFEHNPANPVTRAVVERCPFDADAILLSPAETTGYLGRAKLRLMRRDYIVFMPRFLAFLRPLEPWLTWLPMGAQYVVLAEKHA